MCIHVCVCCVGEGLGTTDLLSINPLNAELNPVCHLLALAGAHHFVHVSRLRVKSVHDIKS